MSVIHPSTHLVFNREESEAIMIADGGMPYQVFTIKASTLSAGGQRPLWSRIYGRGDNSFYLESMRTGKQELFYMSDIKYSPVGDVAHWIFKPAYSDIRMEIRIFND